MKSSSLQLAGALGHATADKRIDILRRIGDAGSISQAARDVGVSYKAAWQAVDTLSNLAGDALVESAVGGSGGGGARLTDAGRELLRMADEVALARSQVLARLAKRPRGAVQLGGVAALGLRTSMRNQLPCTVKALKQQGPMVRVELALGDGTTLASRVTRESTQLLALAPGLPMLALCKATAVHVRASARSTEGRNVIAGQITRASRAPGGEVALSLDGGLQVVGFAAAGSVLRAQTSAVAVVDETAVVLAVAG